ncbi:MAG: RluA family pseudouridine synthase [Thermaurantimonas sp.]
MNKSNIDAQRLADRIIYEDNHLIVLDKQAGELVQADKTGDACLADALKLYIKRTKGKPGNVFLGVTHRLDRPTMGLVIFAKTSKSLSRINEMLRQGLIQKTYKALVEGRIPIGTTGELSHFLIKNQELNKSFVTHSNHRGAKPARLRYECIKEFDTYSLLQIQLLTGRHHQIRCQLAHIGHCLKGDVKYGAKRPNPDGSIGLQAFRLDFIHPVSKKPISCVSRQSLAP